MKTQIAKRTLSILLTVCMLATSLMMPIFAETWSATSNVRIYVATDSGAIDIYDVNEPAIRYANLFAKEYESKFGITPAILYGAKAKAQSGDIILDMDPNNGIAKEGFSISVSSSKLTVSASGYAGLLYGYHDVLKQLLVDGTVDPVTNNAPDVAERSISLDNGRKYFSPDWIKELIREMSWAGMNTLVLHFSEEMGLGLESKTYPWLAGRDGTLCVGESISSDNRYLTQEELRDIAEYAKLYNVELVPAMDTPGHMNYIVKKFNAKAAQGSFTFTYDGTKYTVPKGTNIANYYHYGCSSTTHSASCRDGLVQGSRNTNYSRGIDISNPIAVAFTKSLLTEYATLFLEFGSTKIDIGGDELLGWGASPASGNKWTQLEHWEDYAKAKTGNSKAVAYDAFLLYMNELNRLSRKLGYTSVRMWNDDVLRSGTGWSGVVQLDKNVDIWYWNSGTATVKAYVDAGYSVYNIYEKYTYYALTGSSANGGYKTNYPDANPKTIYNTWTPYYFSDSYTNYSTEVLGGAMGIWCDNPSLKTEREVMSDVLPMLRANAAKSWNTTANSSKSYSTFTSEWSKIGNAPVVEIPNDDALKALIAEFYQTYLPKEDTYTAPSFALYKDEVVNAERFIGLNSVCWNDNTFNLLASNIQEYRDTLVLLGDTSMVLYAMSVYESLLPEKDKYSIESWSTFESSYIACQKMLAARDYDQGKAISMAGGLVGFAEQGLIEESDVAGLRKEALTSAKFQSSTVYQGGVARLTVVLPRNGVVKDVRVVDENGFVVAYGKAQPINIRKPKQITYIVTIPATEIGTHTYTVYATHSYSGLCDYLYCSDPIQCRLTVLE